jgi:hypothetical protein
MSKQAHLVGKIAAILLVTAFLMTNLPYIGATYAAINVTNLGKPTDAASANAYLPLGDYIHQGKPRYVHGIPALLFIGTQWENASADEGWPVIKALDQFGSFSGVKPLADWCTSGPTGQICGDPGFDLDRAQYHSKYVAFVYRDLENRALKCHARLPADEMSLIWANGIKFYRPKHKAPCTLLLSDPRTPFPLVLIGGYFQRSAGLAGSVDFETFLTPPPGHQVTGGPASGLSFTAVQEALVRGTDQPGSSLVHDVNAEANIITALICHADHRLPAKVCGRTVIARLLKHVK